MPVSFGADYGKQTRVNDRHLRWPKERASIGESMISVEPKLTIREWGSGDPVPVYVPAEHLELPSQFAALSGDDAESLARFFKSYGRLGFREIASRDAMAKEHPEFWFPDGVTAQRFKGNPLFGRHLDEPREWIQAHAQTVGWCLRVAAADKELSRRKKAKMFEALYEDFPESVAVGMAVHFPQRVNLSVSSDDFHNPERFKESTFAEKAVGLFTSHVVDRNLRNDGSSRLGWNGNYFINVEGETLLAVIYGMVASALAGGRRLATCEDCGAIFLQTTEKQRFCPPRQGVSRSTCQQRVSLRNKRNKRRQHGRQKK